MTEVKPVQTRGMYIVLEGAEGVGKTTIAQMVVAELEKLGLPARSMHEPDGQADPTTKEIRRLTQDPSYPMNSRTEALLYNAARSQSLEAVHSARDKGNICIVDRSYLTTLAVQFYGRGDIQDYQRLNDIIAFAVGDMWPDLAIVLDAPVEVLKTRANRRGELERFDNLDDAMLERVRAGYLWEARQRDMPVVYATGAVEDVFHDVWRHIAVALGLEHEVVSQPTSVAEVLVKSPAAAVLREKQPVRPLNTMAYYIPPTLPDDLQCDYCDDMDKLLRDRTELVRTLAAHLSSGDKAASTTSTVKQAESILSPLLPLACTDEKFRELIASTERLELDAKTLQSLPNGFASNDEPVTLRSATPRNELDLLPAMLYETLDLPMNEVKSTVEKWPYAVKSELFTQYLRAHPAGKALSQVAYTWEFLAELSLLQDLPETLRQNVSLQALTPRYGYDMPAEVEEADLSDEYDAIFDQSLQLQSTLQARGFAAESQYATLLGHKQRWSITTSIVDIASLLQDKYLDTLAALLNTTHPLLHQSTERKS